MGRKAADPQRHPSFEESSKEGMLAWNAPKAYKPEAKLLVKQALDHHFGDKPWNFTQTDTRERFATWAAGSSTLAALQQEPNRMPEMCYDCAP